jgi:hypothetical protein
MVYLKRSIIQVKTENNSLAHAVIIAKAKLTNDPNYKSYRQEYKILPIGQQLLQTTGIDLSNGGGIPELVRFQDHFWDYKIVVYEGLHCESLMFEGHVESINQIYLIYDSITRHYHVITNLTSAMAKKYICKACNKVRDRDVTHM